MMNSLTERERGNVFLAALQALRPHQWIKNGLLFAGVLFAGKFRDPEALLQASLAFLAFCAVSGGVYVFNDILDWKRDREHPIKRNRPIASGRLPLPGAWVLLLVAWIGGFLGLTALDPSLRLLGIGAAYATLTVSYSLGLKNIAALDVILIALGFVLRAAAGAVAVDTAISPWLIVCTFLLALFLGFGKRRHELLLLGEEGAKHRQSLDEYNKEMLDHLLTITVAATIQSYAIYTILSDTAKHHDGLWYTLPFVVYGLFRYLQLIHRQDEGGSPERIILGDRRLVVCILLWTLSVVVVMFRQ